MSALRDAPGCDSTLLFTDCFPPVTPTFSSEPRFSPSTPLFTDCLLLRPTMLFTSELQNRKMADCSPAQAKGSPIERTQRPPHIHQHPTQDSSPASETTSPPETQRAFQPFLCPSAQRAERARTSSGPDRQDQARNGDGIRWEEVG